MALSILLAEAFVVYFLVLGAHALRHRFGLAPYYALMGGLTAIMSWVTDAGVSVQAAGVTFLVGSTVFYTAIQLGVFVVYVFDGPPATRIAIYTVIGVSAMVPIIALALHLQMALMGHTPLGYVPVPSLRINLSSLFASFVDLLFLAMSWEFFQKQRRWLPLFGRAFLCLLGVMWLDVLLFNTAAFAGQPAFRGILEGTLVSRGVVCLFAAPFLWGYLAWQSRAHQMPSEERPVLAIIKEMTRMERKLCQAQEEIARRKEAEAKLEILATTDDLTGLENRRSFLDKAARECRRARRYGQPLSLIMLDTDRFKRVNDHYGHQTGDQVLAAVAQACRRELRDSDILARLGGEEFAALLPQTGPAESLATAERLRRAVESLAVTSPHGPVQITLSAGTASLGPPADSLDQLLSRADEALYRAKAAGRNQVATA
ncbi:MAG: GGDEF domain-containing protein [Deltaproteobacteria bacterium]|nr:GGDEF domain-containing protein [Deltaproteobacteria bacterium]